MRCRDECQLPTWRMAVEIKPKPVIPYSENAASKTTSNHSIEQGSLLTASCPKANSWLKVGTALPIDLAMPSTHQENCPPTDRSGLLCDRVPGVADAHHLEPMRNLGPRNLRESESWSGKLKPPSGKPNTLPNPRVVASYNRAQTKSNQKKVAKKTTRFRKAGLNIGANLPHFPPNP